MGMKNAPSELWTIIQDLSQFFTQNRFKKRWGQWWWNTLPETKIAPEKRKAIFQPSNHAFSGLWDPFDLWSTAKFRSENIAPNSGRVDNINSHCLWRELEVENDLFTWIPSVSKKNICIACISCIGVILCTYVAKPFFPLVNTGEFKRWVVTPCLGFWFGTEPSGRGLQDVLHALHADGSAPAFNGDALQTQLPIHEELEVASITSQGEWFCEFSLLLIFELWINEHQQKTKASLAF